MRFPSGPKEHINRSSSSWCSKDYLSLILTQLCTSQRRKQKIQVSIGLPEVPKQQLVATAHGPYSQGHVLCLQCYVNLLFWYQFFCGFSGSTMIDYWQMIFFNLFFTSLPPLVFGILDKDISAETLLALPELYKSGQNSEVRWGGLSSSLQVSEKEHWPAVRGLALWSPLCLLPPMWPVAPLPIPSLFLICCWGWWTRPVGIFLFSYFLIISHVNMGLP